MTQVWDFSNVISNWRSNLDLSSTIEGDSANEFINQIQSEIDDLQNFSKFLKIPPPTPLPPDPTPPPPARVKSPSSSREKIPIVKPRIAAKSVVPAKTRLILPKKPVFVSDPARLEVVNYNLNQKYELEFNLQNVSKKTSSFQMKVPKDSAFFLQVVDDVPTSQIVPGLYLTLRLSFTPTEPRDYLDEITFLPAPEEIPTVVPINCYRDPPILVLPDVVDLGATLVYSQKVLSFTIENTGGIAFFSIHSNYGREESFKLSRWSISIIPSQFELKRNAQMTIHVSFKPLEPGFHSVSLEIRAQNFKQKSFFYVKGEASVPNLQFPVTDDKELFLPFLPCTLR